MNEPKMLIPNQVDINQMGMMLGTLGAGELEFAGVLVVRYQQIKGGDEWIPMPTEDFWDIITKDTLSRDWSNNPFWNPDLAGLIIGEWITGWKNGDKEAIGVVTPKFIEAVSNPKVGPQENWAKRKYS